MLNSTVPTPAHGVPVAAGVARSALIANTSWSGSSSFTAADQLRLSSSTHCVPLNLTMSPVSGCTAPAQLRGLGAGRPPGEVLPLTVQAGAVEPPLQTDASFTVVVRLPDWNTAA